MQSKYDYRDPGEDPDYCNGLQMSHSEPKPKPREPKMKGKQHEFMGFCPTCGTGYIYDSDLLRIEDSSGKGVKIYRCLRCKQEVNEGELIPF